MKEQNINVVKYVIHIKHVISLWTDVDECVEDITICGPEAICNNTIGAYFCTCNPGYRVDISDMISSFANPCNGVCAVVLVFGSNNVMCLLA